MTTAVSHSDSYEKRKAEIKKKGNSYASLPTAFQHFYIFYMKPLLDREFTHERKCFLMFVMQAYSWMI